MSLFLDPRYKRSGMEHFMRKIHGELWYHGKLEELILFVKNMYLAYASNY
jgi:hypothetical protein